MHKMDTLSDRYFLAMHAHVCVLRERIIVLDVATGKYLSLDAASARSLRRHVSGWPELEAVRENPAALELLLKQGLITRDPSAGKPANPVRINPPTQWIGEIRPRGSPEIH